MKEKHRELIEKEIEWAMYYFEEFQKKEKAEYEKGEEASSRGVFEEIVRYMGKFKREYLRGRKLEDEALLKGIEKVKK